MTIRSGKKTVLLVAMLFAAALVLADFDDADARRKRKRRKRRRKKPTPAQVETRTPAAQAPSALPAAAPARSNKDRSVKKDKKKRLQVLDFSGIGIEGRLRTPQLLYFLGRVKEELHRASLEKRSFVPELVRSAEEGGF